MYILQGITNRQVSVFYQGRDTARLFCNKKPACSQLKYFAFWIEPALALLSDLLIREDFPSPPVLQLIRPEVWGNSPSVDRNQSLRVVVNLPYREPVNKLKKKITGQSTEKLGIIKDTLHLVFFIINHFFVTCKGASEVASKFGYFRKSSTLAQPLPSNIMTLSYPITDYAGQAPLPLPITSLHKT